MRLRAASAILLLLCLSGRVIDADADIVTVTAGPDTDMANNDFRRIQDALNDAAPGDTIVLSGTFDFTAPFAAAAWALGNDDTPGTGDDYSVYIPGGKNNVTLTANALGEATIQGPGDLAAINLESFLYFNTGDNQDWTISNLQIYDFDLAIGMFAASADAFNGTRIENNVIRLATDLNATVAPNDTNQNIGIHFSFGANQSIQNNTIQIPGNGASDSGAGAFASSVGMQSNISGGSVYDGLTISGNAVHVLNAQAADPETMIGIWENGFAHTSNITVANNSFVNDAPGNNPALNLQRAFRVTSHSSPTTLVTYDSNQVEGASVGFQWIAGRNFTGNQAVVMRGNQITNSTTGVLIQSEGIAHFTGNVITGSGSGGGIHVVTGTLAGSGADTNGVSNTAVSGGSGDGIWIEATAGPSAPITLNDLSGNAGFGLRNETASAIDATRNWWGSNLAANVFAEGSGFVNVLPWLASGTDVSPVFGFQPFVWATSLFTTTTFVGTAAADTGSLQAGDPVTMTMNGVTATTAFAQLVLIDVQMGGSDDVFTLGEIGVPGWSFDGGPGNDTLAGRNDAQTWIITGAGSGSLGGTTFTNVETLRGGTAADAFVFGPSGSLAQGIDGNLGADSLDNTAIPGHTSSPTGAGSLDGAAGSASGVPAFDNIDGIAGTVANLDVQTTGPSSALVGSTISYTITVSSLGPDAAFGAMLSDTLPTGSTFASLSAPAGWSCATPSVNSTGTVTCTRPLTLGSADTFTLVVNAPTTTGFVANIATVSSDTADPIQENNFASATTNVIQQADLAVTKSGPPTAAAGTDITYSITVLNNGPQDATNVSLIDLLPANTTAVSLTQSSGPAFSCPTASGSTGSVGCTIATFANGASATFSLTVNLIPAAPAGTLSNTASVSTSATDPDTLNNSATAETTIAPSADLAIAMTGPASGVAGGSDLVYIVTVTNNGPSNATGVAVADVTPAGLTFVSNAGACTTSYPCALGTLAPGASRVITTTMTVPANFAGTSASNTATVTAATNDPSSANNSATAETTIALSADLAIAMTGPASGVAGGSDLVYIVTVTNNGPSDAAGVSVANVTPPGLTFVGNTGGCATAYPCALGTLAPGALAVITTTMAVPASFNALSPTNMAAVSTSTTDPTASNNSATVATTIARSADLAIAMTGPASGVAGGSDLVYIVTVTNNGPSDAAGVSVADVTPAGLTFVGNTGACAGPYPCALGTLAPGASLAITTTMAVPASFAGASVSNTATVTASTSDPSSGDNSASVTTGVGCPALTLTPSTLRLATLGSSYSQAFTLADGVAPVTFAVTGALPGGVSLSGAALSGTPTERGAFAFTLSATDARGCQASLPLTLAVSRERLITVGQGLGGDPLVRRFANQNWAPVTGPLGDFKAFGPSFTGGVAVASGDTNDDGVADVIAGAGGGSEPLINVFNGADGALRLSFLAFPASLNAGVEVAAGDVNGDGVADIIAAPGFGGPPLVRVFDGRTGGLLREWLAMPASWIGGLHLGAGDVNGDGFADIVTGAGPGGGPLVQVFDGFTGAIVRQFFPYEPEFAGGVYVAAGDVSGDGIADIVTGAGAGGGPHVRVFDGVTTAQIPGPLGNFFAYAPLFGGGVRVAAGDVNGDGVADVITGAGPGGGPHVRLFDGASGDEVFGFFAFDTGVGTFVSGPPSLARMVIDTPRPDADVTTSVRVAGWAFEESSVDGAGIDAVHVWAYPGAGGSPLFVGAATSLGPRPDVAAVVGGEFLMSGFDVSGTLPPGTYDLVVYVRNAATRVFDNRRMVRVTVR